MMELRSPRRALKILDDKFQSVHSQHWFLCEGSQSFKVSMGLVLQAEGSQVSELTHVAEDSEEEVCCCTLS